MQDFRVVNKYLNKRQAERFAFFICKFIFSFQIFLLPLDNVVLNQIIDNQCKIESFR